MASVQASRWSVWAAVALIGVLGPAQLCGQSLTTSSAQLPRHVTSATAAPLVVQLQGAETAQERAANRAQEATWHEQDQRWTIGIGIAAALAAFLQGIVLIWQIVYLRRTVRDSEQAVRAAQRSAKAAEDALAKSDEVLQHARLSSQTELRPYVFVDDVSWEWLHQIGEDPETIAFWRIIVSWRNTGKTPARRVFVSANNGAFPGELPPGYSFPNGDGRPQLVGSLGPNQNIRNRSDIPIEDVMALWNGDQRRYFWGWVEYDGFEGAGRHRTEFCVEIKVFNHPLNKQFSPIGILVSVMNGSDETCRYEPMT